MECNLENNARDIKFWIATAVDSHTTLAASTYTYFTSDTVAGGTNDWVTNNTEDDDEDAPWCTPPDDAASQYACKEIICVADRLRETGDTYDWGFIYGTTANPNEDVITVKAGLSRLSFNMDSVTAPVYIYGPAADVTLNLPSGAMGLGIGAAVTVLAGALGY